MSKKMICRTCKKELVAVPYGWGFVCDCPGTKAGYPEELMGEGDE